MLLTKIILVVALTLSIILPLGYYFIGEQSKKRYKTSLLTNVFFFFGTLILTGIILFNGDITYAAEAAPAVGSNLNAGLGYIGAALAVGLSGIGGGIGVATSASAALGAISEDASIFGKSIIFVAMAEGIALYGLLIAFMILTKF